MALPIDGNAISLYEYGQMSNDPVIKKFVFSLYEDNSITQDIPFCTDSQLVSAAYRWTGNLPEVNAVPLNTLPPVVKGVPQYYTEPKYIWLNQVQSAGILRRDKNGVASDPMAEQMRAYWKSKTYRVNTDFFNNDHVTGDENSMVGLRYRLTPANMAQFGIPSELAIDAGGITMELADLTVAISNQWIETVDALLSFMQADDGTGIILYMNDILKRRFAAAVRTLGTQGFEITRDAYDRTVERYRNAVIRDPGRQNDQITRIISPTETAAGLPGSSTFTSLYAVRATGLEDFCGMQFEPPMVIGPERLPGTDQYATTFQWVWGLWQINNRSVGRIYDINIGTGTI